jgi:hypothetical protein
MFIKLREAAYHRFVVPLDGVDLETNEITASPGENLDIVGMKRRAPCAGIDLDFDSRDVQLW